jgi:hypothetical protein
MIAFGTDVLQIGVCLILKSWKDILSVGMVKLESSPIFHTVVCTIRPVSAGPKSSSLSTVEYQLSGEQMA